MDSIANLYNAEPPSLRRVNFNDLAILLKDWLSEPLLWPAP